MPEPTLGLVMIVRDEAVNLPRSLAPVADRFDEAVVLDTGSRDQTPRLAASMGAKVYHADWTENFAAARNRALELATADWLLWLDGDNAISASDVAVLRSNLPVEGPAILWAREVVLPAGETLWQKRCFPRLPQVGFQGRVHEQLVHPATWPQILTPVRIDHWGYVDPMLKKAKVVYYLSLLEQSLQESPNDFYSRWQAGRCLSDQRQFGKAAEYFACVARDPQARTANPEIWLHGFLQWATCLERLGQPGPAQATIRQLLEEAPESGPAHLAMGRLAYQQADWQTAARHLGQALALGMGLPLVDRDPRRQSFQAAYYLGRALERLGRGWEATQALSHAIDLAPENLAARAELARLLWDSQRRDLARAELQQVLEMDPSHRQARRLLAQWEEAA